MSGLVAVLVALIGRDSRRTAEAAKDAGAEAARAYKLRGELLKGAQDDLDAAVTELRQAREELDTARQETTDCYDALEWAHTALAHLAERTGTSLDALGPPPWRHDDDVDPPAGRT